MSEHERDQIEEATCDDDQDIQLETPSESDDEDYENDSIRALIQYRIMYEKRQGIISIECFQR